MCIRDRDYFLPDADREAQKRVFEPQLELAARLGLPVVIHDRDADEDMLDMLRRHPVPGMIHRFFSQAQYGFCLLYTSWHAPKGTEALN